MCRTLEPGFLTMESLLISETEEASCPSNGLHAGRPWRGGKLLWTMVSTRKGLFGHSRAEWRRRQGSIPMHCRWRDEWGNHRLDDRNSVFQLDSFRWMGMRGVPPSMFTLVGNSPWLHLARCGAYQGFSTQLGPVVCSLTSSVIWAQDEQNINCQVILERVWWQEGRALVF